MGNNQGGENQVKEDHSKEVKIVEQVKSSILQLPNEIIFEIFLFLPVFDILKSVACKRMHQIVNSNQFWRILCLRFVNERDLTTDNPKNFFLKLYSSNQERFCSINDELIVSHNHRVVQGDMHSIFPNCWRTSYLKNIVGKEGKTSVKFKLSTTTNSGSFPLDGVCFGISKKISNDSDLGLAIGLEKMNSLGFLLERKVYVNGKLCQVEKNEEKNDFEEKKKKMENIVDNEGFIVEIGVDMDKKSTPILFFDVQDWYYEELPIYEGGDCYKMITEGGGMMFGCSLYYTHVIVEILPHIFV